MCRSESVITDAPKVVDRSRAVRATFGFSERRAALMVLDLILLNVALLFALDLWSVLMPASANRTMSRSMFAPLYERPGWFALLSLLWFPIARAFDAYEFSKVSNLTGSVFGIVKAGLVTLTVYLLIPYLPPALPGSRSAIFVLYGLTLGLLVAGRLGYSAVFRQPLFVPKALIIGAGWAGRTIAEAICQYGVNCCRIVGFIDDDPQKAGSVVTVELGKSVDGGKTPKLKKRSHSSSNGLDSELRFASEGSARFPVMGSRQQLPDLIRDHGINTLVLAITHSVNGELLQTLMDCLELGVEIVPMPVLYEQLTGRVPIEHVGSHWHVAMPIDHPGTGAVWPMVKRLSDIVLASAGLLVMLPFFPVIALAIYLDSPGPVFYTQDRVGKNGRVFKLYKFRTMKVDAEKDGPKWAEKNDQRVTRVGKLLRATHVDEFPQFINILKGEMSAVGPRPERPEFVEELAKEIPFYRVRHAVKPGMAGWGLVKQGYGASKEDALIKLQYDLYYIKHQSLWLDMVILIKTIIDTVTFRGR